MAQRDESEPASTMALIGSALLIVVFALEFIGVAIGVIPADASNGRRLFFGILFGLGVVTSTLAFVTLYRRGRSAPAGDPDDTD